MRLWKKKDRGPYPKTFAKRLTWRIMVTLFCVMSVVSLIIFGIAWAMVYAQAYLLTDRVLESKRMKIERVLSETYVAAVNTVPDIENSLDRPDRMKDIMRRIVELNPDVRSCGISFRENYYPEKGRWYCPYAQRADSDSIVVMKSIGGAKQDYLKAEWFTEALKAKEGYWSKPFFDGRDKKTALVAYLVPIRDERDSTVAVLGVDLALDRLFARHLNLESDSSGNKEWTAEDELYYMVIDSAGTYLRHPDATRIIKENFFDYAKGASCSGAEELGRKMTKGEKGYMDSDADDKELVIEGEEVNASYLPFEHTPWSIALVIPTFFINLFSYLLGGFLLFFILLGLIVVFFAGRRGIKKVSRPLRQLASSADEVAKGNFNTQLPVVTTHDEIHQLRDSFENMQQSLTRYIQELQETTAQKASMESELKIAHDIQMSMLPKTFPPYPQRHDIDIYGSLTPAKGVGGDLFDFYIRDEKLFFCIGDVSGKGVPASLYMAVTRSLFRNISAHENEPGAIVDALNESMTESNDTNMFVTAFVGVLDLATGMLSYCNAGHDAPLLVGHDVGCLSCDPNLPIGVIQDYRFTQQEASIDHGTTIFLFTDGLNEAEDSQHAQFGDLRIMSVAKRLLSEGMHQPTPMIEQMTAAVHAFVGDAEQSDDLTMLAIQYKGED